MYMQAGALRHKITIQKPCDETGHVTAFSQNWEDVCKVRACIETIAGREVWQAEQAQSLLTHRITIRNRHDLRPNMRVLHGCRVYEIMYITEVDEAKRWLRLMCRENDALRISGGTNDD